MISDVIRHNFGIPMLDAKLTSEQEIPLMPSSPFVCHLILLDHGQFILFALNRFIWMTMKNERLGASMACDDAWVLIISIFFLPNLL